MAALQGHIQCVWQASYHLQTSVLCHPNGYLITFVRAGTEVAKNINKNNANHAIVFEAIALALALEADTDLLTASVGLLGKFISVREPNIKYLGLENMVRLAEVPAVNDAIVRYVAWKVLHCEML